MSIPPEPLPLFAPDPSVPEPLSVPVDNEEPPRSPVHAAIKAPVETTAPAHIHQLVFFMAPLQAISADTQTPQLMRA
jgi:hypothetical protein